MSDWYRLEDWDDAREAEFFRRLKRARHQKPQYLVIQAHTLVRTGRSDLAGVALHLVELFCQSHYDPFFASNAYYTKAQALVRLDRWDDAFEAFEQALAARRESPTIINNAWLEYVLTVATRRARHRYQRALDVMQEFVEPSGLMLPLSQFQYFAALALISADEGDRSGAARWATNALAATSRSSPLSGHAGLGEVGNAYAALRDELREIAANAEKDL